MNNEFAMLTSFYMESHCRLHTPLGYLNNGDNKGKKTRLHALQIGEAGARELPRSV